LDEKDQEENAFLKCILSHRYIIFVAQHITVNL